MIRMPVISVKSQQLCYYGDFTHDRTKVSGHGFIRRKPKALARLGLRGHRVRFSDKFANFELGGQSLSP